MGNLSGSKRAFTYSYILFSIDFVTNKIEETTGMDINRDGHVGGGGVTGKVEKATHMDINRDGRIGGNQAPGGGM